jgi:peptidase inhibitor family I36
MLAPDNPIFKRGTDMLRRLAMLLGLVALVVALTGATAQASPAHLNYTQAKAMAAVGTCPSGYWCGWEDIGYSGSSILFDSNWRGSCYSFTGFWSQRISSWQNYIGSQTSSHNLWGCPSYQGSRVWGYNGFTVGDARVWGFNDQTVSVYWWP